MTILEEPIPQFSLNDIDKIYTVDQESQKKRYDTLKTKFKQRFGIDPQFYARSPGRVNLIGEHIDYSGYSVLPMAIERDCVMAVRATVSDQPTVTLINTNSVYPDRFFEHEKEGHVTIDSTVHDWCNYFKCGYKGVLDKLNPHEIYSLQIVVDGTVPPGSGLSSSSAFVCCAALATSYAHKSSPTKGDLTKTAITSETLAGVQIGGMDQSISIMAPKDSALLIDFYPYLDATPIPFPKIQPAPVFVIANTMVTADKHVTAPTNYNLRVVETRLAAALLRHNLNLKMKDGIVTLKQVQEAFVGLTDPILALEGMLEAVEKHIQKEPFTLDTIAKALDCTTEQVSGTYIGSITIQATDFKLYERAKHVYSEAKLVYEFKRVCGQNPPPSDILQQLGDLMNKSHSSCRDLFNCSCVELDQLTDICLGSGAYGSRLTGAGWGGCTVSLVDRERVGEFIEQVNEKYYKNHESKDHLFPTFPSIGALILE